MSGIADFIQELMVTVDRSYPTAGQMGYYNEPSPFYASSAGDVAALSSAVLNVWCALLAFVKLWWVAPMETHATQRVDVSLSRQIKRLQAIIGHRLRDSRAGRFLILLSFSGLAYCTFWVSRVPPSASFAN